MHDQFRDIFTPRELMTLASIVQVGDATYRELMETQRPMFGHPYFDDTRGRIRTKVVQMQREFQYNQRVPELRNKKVILHVARSASPNDLPYPSKYKVNLSNNNHAIQRQMVIDDDLTPPYGDAPYYGILTFGGRGQTFAVVQFPEPGYTGVAEQFFLPQITVNGESENAKVFERKKAALKKEILAHGIQEGIS